MEREEVEREREREGSYQGLNRDVLMISGSEVSNSRAFYGMYWQGVYSFPSKILYMLQGELDTELLLFVQPRGLNGFLLELCTVVKQGSRGL